MAKSNTRITADKDEVAIYTYEYTATSGQTTFSGSDDNSATLDYTAGSITVSYGGLELPESDYTATNGTSIVLADGAVAGEIIRVVAYEPFVVSDALPITGGTLTGGLNVSSGNVGIGTSSPSRRFTVQGSSSDNLPVRVIGGASTSKAHMEFQDPTTTANYKVTIGSVGDNLTLQAGGSERMRIDSSGRVTTPNQPSFSVYNTANYSGTGSLVFSQVYHNEGNNYNTTNGVFTAPVAGVYHFSFSFVFNNTTTYLWGGLRVNGVAKSLSFHGTSSPEPYDQRCISTTVKLNANDAVTINIGSSGGGHFEGARHNFSGHLVG